MADEANNEERIRLRAYFLWLAERRTYNTGSFQRKSSRMRIDKQDI